MYTKFIEIIAEPKAGGNQNNLFLNARPFGLFYFSHG
jgi:hypothetical protein